MTAVSRALKRVDSPLRSSRHDVLEGQYDSGRERERERGREGERKRAASVCVVYTNDSEAGALRCSLHAHYSHI